MDKNKWKETWANLLDKLSFLRLSDDLEDDEEELLVEEKELVLGRDLPEGNLKEKLEWNRRRTARHRIFLVVLVIAIVGGFWMYNTVHVFRDYVIGESQEIEVASGTQYASIGKKLLRYNSDGVSCMSRDSDTEWSITYSMQAPIADVCYHTMVIAEQQGTQVYVVNENGMIGSFDTQIPILKARAARQGVVALVLQEEDVTWINLYTADGTVIASNKTAIGETGYPLDIDVSPDGQKLAVSYLSVKDGVMTDHVIFYHFGSAGQGKENNIVSGADYVGTVIPQIYFTDNARAVAVSDQGFYVFQGSDAPKERVQVSFDEEIISSFHDEERIGFLFLNEEEGSEEEYRMELYSYGGKRKASKKIDARFDNIKIENGQILMYSDRGFDVFTKSGRLRFSSAYEKAVEEFFYFGEFRKYLVITKDSFDKIRVG